MENSTISNRYRILQKLGEGGFGQTFLAEDLHLPTKPRCVVKQLRPQCTDDESINLARRLFEQEAEVLYRLGNHPCIPNLLAHFEEKGEFYLVQELIEGYTLAQEVANGKRFSEKAIIDFLRQSLSVLSFVHQQNVIHRDLKPSNLIRRYSDGRIFVIDFGAVKQVNVNQNNQNPTFHSTIAIGSEGYMPSEQVAGKPRFASDIYALGLVAIELMTGLHPLKLNQNNNTGEFVWHHKVQIRKELFAFVSRMIRYDFRQRYNSAVEAFSALKVIAPAANPGPAAQPLPKMPIVVQQQQYVLPPQYAQPPQQAQPQYAQPQYAQPPYPLPEPKFAQPAPPYAPQQAPLYPPAPASAQHSIMTQQQPDIHLPTMVVPIRKSSDSENKGFLGWLWNNDLALGAFVTAAVIGIFVFGGYLLISSVASGSNSTVSQNSPVAPTQTGKSYDVFQEALAQASEAETKEKKATTKFEWDEITNHYKRASQLLSSIEASSPSYAEAQKKIGEFESKIRLAFLKSKEIQNNDSTASSSTSPATPTTISSTSLATTAPEQAPIKSLKVAKMPAPRREKSYLVFNSSEGDYIGKGLDWSFTSTESKFTANGSKRYLTLGVDGDKWFHLTIGVPDNMTLQKGSYESGSGSSNTSPSMSFSGDGRGCTVGDGNFTINNILFSESGKEVLYLDLSFRQRCQNTTAVLLGRWRYDARY